MTNYALVLGTKFYGNSYSMDGNDYSTLVWESDTPKPTQAELDALWPQVQYETQVAVVELNRRVAYETNSDPIFFQWQRNQATEAEWREAVAKVKAENPYPKAP